MASPLHILHLEDNPDDALLIRLKLEAEGVPADITVVDNRPAFEEALANDKVDLILADFNVPGFDGLVALEAVRKRNRRLPFIFVSGALGEDQAVETLKSGATDFVLKDRLSRLIPAIHRALAEVEEHARREQAERELRKSEERVRQALQVGRMFAFEWDPLTDQVERSSHCAEILGITHGATQDTGQGFLNRIHPEDRAKFSKLLQQLNPTADSYRTTYRVIRPDNSAIVLQEAARGFFDANGKLTRLVGIAADVTLREQAQRALEWELAVNEAVSRLATELIAPASTIEQVADAVLAQALRLTGSLHGLVSSIDPATKHNVCHTFTRMMQGECQITGDNRKISFAPASDGSYAGVWGMVLNTRKAFYINEPVTHHPASVGLPPGHLPINRFLSVPVFLGKEVVGQISVANADGDYTDKELSAVIRLAEHYALGIQRLRFKQALQSERDFVHAILATAGALVVVLDTQGRIVRFNQACELTTGYRFEEVVGKQFWDVFLVPEEIEAVKSLFNRLTAGQFPAGHENYWLAKDGSRRRIMWSNTALLDEEKSVEYVIATGVDVTQTREAEGKLRVLTRAMEAGPSSVVITNGQGVISYVNPTFAHLTGYAPEELVGKNPRLWKSGQHPPEYYQALWQRLSEGLEWRGEFCNKKKDGSLFWIYATISPIKDETGNISHFVAVTVDITERKHYEQALHQAREELEQKVVERTADLNRSLQALNLEVEARRRAETEIHELLHLERIVTEISADFASLTTGHFQQALKEAVGRLMEFLKADAAVLAEFVGKETRIEVRCQPSEDGAVQEQLPTKKFPWTWSHLRQQQRVCFSSVDELPQEAYRDIQSYREAGVESVLALPLVVSKDAIGALVFMTFGRKCHWPAETLRRMRIVENLFANQLMRWRSEQALSEAETRFHAVADFVRDWEYWESPQGAILFCSRACEPITGYRPEQFLVQPSLLETIVVPEDATAWHDHHRQASKHPGPYSLEFRIRRADQEVRWIQHYCQPIFDDQGQFLGFRVNNRDITTIKETELETQQFRVELSRMSRAAMADQLAASLAHELRQPLTAIMSNAEAATQFLAQAPPDITEVREALSDIVQNNERASEVIQRLRALYRKTGLERTALNLNKIIEDTLVLLRTELIFRRISWRMELAPSLPPAYCNRVELQQVLMNLVLNAADAMAAVALDSRLLVISTTLEGPTHLQVALRDSGIGFAPDDAEKLFEPFFTTKETGMGMGLALCRSIIRAHNGRLWAKNNNDCGATFYYTVPIYTENTL